MIYNININFPANKEPPAMKIGKKESVICYLEPSQKTQLKELSKRTGIPQQEYIREAINMVLERYKKELKS
ncbi:MAG: ribbon-helix-helix domain-containing protein [Sedimenticola sp.]